MATNGKGMNIFVLAIVCPLLVASVTGIVFMYGDLRVAKANDETAAAKNAEQDAILDEIPTIAANVAAMAATVGTLATDQKAFMKKVDTYIRKDIERDAREHHTHAGGNP